ncbi:MAG: DUF2834 domain-containing protein [Cyanobium sp.]
MAYSNSGPYPDPSRGGQPPEQANRITPLAWLYLMLALAGGILPWIANLAFAREHGPGFDIGLFVRLANANPAAQSLSRDLAIGATAVTIWMVSESRRIGMRGLGWVLLSCVTVAFAFGAPLFLHLRERRLGELRASGALDPEENRQQSARSAAGSSQGETHQ